MNTINDAPWMVIGDFNEIMRIDEKVGRDDRNANQMASFRDALTDCSLLDMGYTGPSFTWSNKRADHALVRALLDRGMANSAWL